MRDGHVQSLYLPQIMKFIIMKFDQKTIVFKSEALTLQSIDLGAGGKEFSMPVGYRYYSRECGT